MLSIFLFILTVTLVLVSFFLILVVLSQKAKSDGGVGAAMGGGMAEAAFGAETSTVLSKMTIVSTILFFVLALSLYLGRMYENKHPSGGGALPDIAGSSSVTPLLNLPAAPMPAPAGGSTTATAPGTTPATVPLTPAPAPAAPAPGAAK